MSEWSDWSMCSVTCGVGQMFRKRTYLNKDGNEDTCGQPTVESENCIGKNYALILIICLFHYSVLINNNNNNLINI